MASMEWPKPAEPGAEEHLEKGPEEEELDAAVKAFDRAAEAKRASGVGSTYAENKALDEAHEALRTAIESAKNAGVSVDRSIIDRVSSVKLGSGFGKKTE